MLKLGGRIHAQGSRRCHRGRGQRHRSGHRGRLKRRDGRGRKACSRSWLGRRRWRHRDGRGDAMRRRGSNRRGLNFLCRSRWRENTNEEECQDRNLARTRHLFAPQSRRRRAVQDPAARLRKLVGGVKVSHRSDRQWNRQTLDNRQILPNINVLPNGRLAARAGCEESGEWRARTACESGCAATTARSWR